MNTVALTRHDETFNLLVNKLVSEGCAAGALKVAEQLRSDQAIGKFALEVEGK